MKVSRPKSDRVLGDNHTPAQVIAKGLISSVAVVWLANSGPRPDGQGDPGFCENRPAVVEL